MESFIGVQIGKSANEAIVTTIETFILAIFSYGLLSWPTLREFVILQPEIVVFSTVIFDWLIVRFTGLRLLELWRFRKLITG